ncbi:MAG: dihydrofolate reductase, partial [Bacteroidota bacterium]
MRTLSTIFIMSIAISAFSSPQAGKENKKAGKDDFKYLTEQFADSKILRYQVPGFENLSLKQKELVYYLSQAALCGRDITYDQNYKSNLLIRKTLEAVYNDFKGDKTTEDYKKFVVYLKRVWFCNGIHHHYSTDKFLPEFSKDYFETLIRNTISTSLPLAKGQNKEQFIVEMTPLLFNPDVAPKRVSLDPDRDMVLGSASNFYDGVSQKEAEDFYATMKKDARKNKQDTLVAFGLNSKLVKENGKIVEKTYKVGGLYSPAIEQIVMWLEKALIVTETPEQNDAVKK